MSFQAVVTDIRLVSRQGLEALWQMTLSDTQFAEGRTGRLEAVTRTGTRLSLPVTEVCRDTDGLLWHTVDKPLAAGTDVTGHVVQPAA